MYHISRAIYREIAPDIEGGREAHEDALRSCEKTIERLVADRHYFARPARALFQDLRPHVAMQAQPHVLRVVQRYVGVAQELLERAPVATSGVDVLGQPVQCRATTRRGTPCQRVPLHPNGYCPSHQHLADTEDVEIPIAA